MSRAQLRTALVAAAFALAVLALLVPAAAPQALPALPAVRARYEALKAQAPRDEAIRARISAIDRALAEAERLGRTGEARRLLAEGIARMSGRGWTEADDYDESLVLRADRIVLDSARRAALRLEQIYAPALALAVPPSARVSLRPLLAQASLAPERYPLAAIDEVPRDLRESPLTLDLDLAAVPNGPYVLDVDLSADGGLLASVGLRVWLHKGLDETLAALERSAADAPARLRAEIGYAGALIRQIDRGHAEVTAFDLPAVLEAAAAVARAAAAGQDPFAGRTGDIERHHRLAGTDDILPYRVYVPKRSPADEERLPLIVALHGGGAREGAWLEHYGRRLPELAEARGYVIAAPLGYRPDGGYGAESPAGAERAGEAGLEARRARELSERDVLAVVARVREDYPIDERRIYLVGHSMGATGAWHLAARYPDLWAGLAAFAGRGPVASVRRMGDVRQFVVHGADDRTTPVEASRAMVAEMRRLGVDVAYVEVPGGTHQDVVVPHLEAMFDFFDADPGPRGRFGRKLAG